MNDFFIGTVQSSNDENQPGHKHHTIKSLSKLTKDEYTELINSIDTIGRFLSTSQLYLLVSLNFNEFMGLSNKYLLEFKRNDYSTINVYPINININRVFLNLLSSFRSYLDFMDRTLKKRYGKDSAQLRNFTQICSREYDNNFSYRFLYHLRNYSQHKGYPINHISLGKRKNPNNQQEVSFHFDLLISRNEILDNYDWRILKQEIKSLPERIDVFPLVSSLMDSLMKIQIQVITDMFTTLKDIAQKIITISKDVRQDENELLVFDFVYDGVKIKNIIQKSLPLKLAQLIVEGKIEEIFQYPEKNSN